MRIEETGEKSLYKDGFKSADDALDALDRDDVQQCYPECRFEVEPDILKPGVRHAHQ